LISSVTPRSTTEQIGCNAPFFLSAEDGAQKAIAQRQQASLRARLRSDVRDAAVTCASVEQKPIPKFQIDEPDVRQTNVSTPHAARSVSGG
jgi:hypothetical protein